MPKLSPALMWLLQHQLIHFKVLFEFFTCFLQVFVYCNPIQTLFPLHFKSWGYHMSKLDNSKLGSTQQQKICWHWHVARIISLQKIYGLYARKHHLVEMRGDVTDAWRRTTTEDRATQPMKAGGWVSQKKDIVRA